MTKNCVSTGRILMILLVQLLMALQVSSVDALSSLAATTRRSFLVTIPFITAATRIDCWALDMDAFINAELDKDDCDPSSKRCIPKNKMSDDEALCKFGQPSKERGEACVRAGMSIQLKQGGVDAFGKLNRGDFVRCKQFYDLENGAYVKKTECN